MELPVLNLLFLALIFLNKALSRGLRLMESPRLDSSLKQLIQFRRGTSRVALLASVFNIQSRKRTHSLRNQKPHPQGKGKADTRVEPARLEAPIPFVGVSHVRD